MSMKLAFMQKRKGMLNITISDLETAIPMVRYWKIILMIQEDKAA